MKFSLPLKHIYVTQPFGVNWVSEGFYSQFGLSADAHNGIDFRLKPGAVVYACHDGVITKQIKSKTFGNYIVLNNVINGDGYETVYGHLSGFLLPEGKEVKKGEPIATGGNTGTASSGAHLHLGYREIKNHKRTDYDNGFLGSKNPAEHFPKDWDKTRAYHRYGRKQDWLAEFKMRFKNIWLHKQLKKRGRLQNIYKTEFINALVYGGWSFDEVMTPSLYFVWAYLKKDEFFDGQKPFA